MIARIRIQVQVVGSGEWVEPEETDGVGYVSLREARIVWEHIRHGYTDCYVRFVTESGAS